ncbi:MAG: BlaI/MecI/CopY family transcriptional regulator [Cyclobacteriaceae bacterium]|jgi:BlaI family transcriptional regulator, penicillinase repressor|nr:BlaI/MecI/CopY family transcriptional regulator [Cyclobacteriaceae bacterium]
MNQLTKTEEMIMKHLWKLEKAFMKDLVDQFPEPRPAYTTTATVLTRMIDKGYVAYNQFGKVREYYPVLKKGEYFKNHVNGIVKNFFNNSASQFAFFFTSKSDMSLTELKELKQLLEEQIEKKRK